MESSAFVPSRLIQIKFRSLMFDQGARTALPARRSTASGPFLLDLGMGEQRSQTGPTYDVDLNTYCISPRQLELYGVCGEWKRYAKRQCKLYRRLDL
jgi:hypothetical protein